jgi:Tol biopolymer transport system component
LSISPTLKPHDRFSHYRVIGPLGAGGMGEVYRAKDESLERDVALKILPPALVRSEERLRRFVLEAKSASSLNHPNIVTIYEIGQVEVGSAPLHFISMELVSGETLTTKIHEEKTDLKTLLGWLAQAAEGLAKAHGAGIVHRDLKPGNIMVSHDGYAKVLDFGLAKLTERQGADADLTSAPTRTADHTGDGVVLGTIGYMSPEQVQGKPVDHRSDIFSFGCILYEATTRRKPFDADSSLESMHKILKDDPPPIDASSAGAPAELRRLIRRCLAKNPDERHHSMKDIAIELKEIGEEYAGSATARPRRRALVATLVALAIAGLILGGWVLLHRHDIAGGTTSSFQAVKMTRLASFDDLQDAALSPDGRFLAYALQKNGLYGLWVRQIATGSDITVVPPRAEFVGRLTFSPDGNYLYYGAIDAQNQNYYTLYRVPTLGGPARKLIDDVDSTVTFSPDGKQLAFVRYASASRESQLMIASAEGSGERKLSAKRLPEQIFTLSWSPDGARIAVDVENSIGADRSDLLEVSTSDATETSIGPKYMGIRRNVVWLPDGSGLAMTQGAIDGSRQVWFVPYPHGEARRITNDANNYSEISVSADSKTLAVTQERWKTRLWVAPVGDPGLAKEVRSVSAGGGSIMQISATFERSVVYRVSRDETSRIWSLPPDGTPPLRLSPDDLRAFAPKVARGSHTIAFTGRRADGIPHIWRMDLDGGNLVQLTNGDGEAVWALSPDGQTMITVKPGEPGLWKTPIAGGSAVKIADRFLNLAKYSPDGKYVLVLAIEGAAGRDRQKLEVIPADGGAPIRIFDLPVGASAFSSRPAGKSKAGWMPSGDGLIYIRELDGVGNLWSQSLAGGEPKPFTHFESGKIAEFDFSPDGRQLFFTRDEVSTDVVLITNFK